MTEGSLTNEAHHIYSSLREKVVEHIFVGEVLRALWRRGIYNLEIMRSEFDAHGYDLVMVRGNIIRHIQFKTSVQPKPKTLSLATALEAKPSGCVIWIQVNHALDIVSFRWFGGTPGEPIPSLGDKRSKRIGRDATGERPMREAHRSVSGSAFKKLDSIDQVLECLFGELPKGRPAVLVNEEDFSEAESEL